MKRYRIVSSPMSDAVPEAVIAHFGWEDNGYRPYASARLSFWNGNLCLRMICREDDPLIRWHGGPEAEAWRDSCLEFFLMPGGTDRYLNLEMNAGGGYRCEVGTGRGDRIFCDVFAEGGKPAATVGDGFWQVDAILSPGKILALTGAPAFRALRGNFYKCGDDTAFPHFGMWHPIETPEPDFHVPAFFGELILPEESSAADGGVDLDRINALARKQKTLGLSPAEKEEQRQLRAAYLLAVRAQLTGILDNTYLEYPDGERVKLRKKDNV